MRYSYEYKRKCVELYRQGQWSETPDGIKDPKNFHKMIRRWARMEEANGTEVLHHKNLNSTWTPEQKLELVSQVLTGRSIQDVALSAGISGGLLYRWLQKYKTKGYTCQLQSFLKEHGIIQSMSRKGNCYDNCIMETFFGRLKNEMYYGCEKEYTSFETFAVAIEEYIDYYNNKRIQAKTKWMPPVKYREASMCCV